jgi:hypothetical protein
MKNELVPRPVSLRVPARLELGPDWYRLALDDL